MSRTKKVILTATSLLIVAAIAVTAVLLLNRNPLLGLASAMGRTVSENFALDITAEIGFEKENLFEYNAEGEFYASNGSDGSGMLMYTPGGTKDDYTYSSGGYVLTMNADGSGSLEHDDTDDTLSEKLSEALANGDYESVAEILNDDVFKEQVLDPSAFAEKLSELVTNVTDVEYLEENFDFKVESEGESDIYSFETPRKSINDVLENILTELEPVFSNKDYPQFVRNVITELGFRLTEDVFIGFELDFVVRDRYLTEIVFAFSVSEDADELSSGTEICLSVRFDDIGETDVNGGVIEEFNKRKTQLGNEEYISWDKNGNVSYKKPE